MQEYYTWFPYLLKSDIVEVLKRLGMVKWHRKKFFVEASVILKVELVDLLQIL